MGKLSKRKGQRGEREWALFLRSRGGFDTARRGCQNAGGPDSPDVVCSVLDASTDINVADMITDFSNGTDKIGLEDKTFSDLTITQISSGSFSGDVQIKDASSNKILFLLDDKDVGLIDADDFIVTDFV